MDREKKKRRKRRSFNKELKAEAVRLCKVGDRTIAQVARDLDLTETALRDWVKQAEIDATAHAGSSVHGTGIASGPLTTQEREELVRLRRLIGIRFSSVAGKRPTNPLDNTGQRRFCG